MKVYVLVPCNYSDITLERRRLDRLFRTVKKAIDNKSENVDIEVRICGLHGNGENTAKYLKSTYGVVTVPKGTGYPDNRRHLLMKSIKGEIKEDDRFVFLDSDDMVSDDFFKEIDPNDKSKDIWRSGRSSVVASDDGTLAVKIPSGDYADNTYMRDCITEYTPTSDKEYFMNNVLRGNYGGQIWGNFFPASMLDTVYNTLQYISMWEDVRFWVELPDYEIRSLKGTYYWVRNNPESICSTVSRDRKNHKFATNVQAIIWALQDMGLNPDGYPILKAARVYLNGDPKFVTEDWPYDPSDRRIIEVTNELRTMPNLRTYLNGEGRGILDSSFYHNGEYLSNLMDFLNCIVI